MEKTREEYLEMVKEDGFSIFDVPKELLDEEMILEACKSNGSILESISDEIKTYEMCFKVCESACGAIEYVPVKFRDKKMCLMVCGTSGYTLEYVPKELRDKEMCLVACRTNMFSPDDIPEEVFDYEFCMELCKINGLYLEYVPKDIKDEKMCQEAFHDTIDAIRYIPEKFISEEICEEAIAKKGSLFEFVPNKYKDKGLCLKVLGYFKDAYKFFPKEHFEDREFVFEACKINTAVICVLPKAYLDDKEFAIFLCAKNAIYFPSFSSRLRYDKDVVMAAFKCNQGYGKYDVCKSILEDEMNPMNKDMDVLRKIATKIPRGFCLPGYKISIKEIAIMAILCVGDVYQYVSDELKDDKDVCSVAIGSNGGMIEKVPLKNRSLKAYAYAVSSLKNPYDIEKVDKAYLTKEFYLHAFKNNRTFMDKIPKHLLGEKEFVLVNRVYEMLGKAKGSIIRMTTNEVKKVISKDIDTILCFEPEVLLDNMVYAALRKSAKASEYAKSLDFDGEFDMEFIEDLQLLIEEKLG